VLVLLQLLQAAAEQTSDPPVSQAELVARVVRDWHSRPPPEPPYSLAVCAVVHDEAIYLLEWAAFHSLVGVQHFYIYDNESEDETEATLAPLISAGWVTYTAWPGDKRSAQERMLDECFSPSSHIASQLTAGGWIAHFDIDEFLIPVSQTLWGVAGALVGADTFVLHDLLSAYADVGIGAVSVDRVEFGASGHATRPPGLVMQNYAERLVDVGPATESLGKLLVRPAAVLSHQGGHVPPILAAPARAARANRVPWAEAHHTKCLEPLRIHHYVTRSLEECAARAASSRLVALRESWRRAAGGALCDRHSAASPLWARIEHMVDTTLASSPIAAATAVLIESLTPANGTPMFLDGA